VISTLHAIRDWLRSDMLVWRWVFLGIYLAILASVFVYLLIQRADRAFYFIWLGILLGAQALFIFGGGTIHLCRPIRKRRLILPVAVASFMFTVLAGGLIVALSEFLHADDSILFKNDGLLFWIILALSWLAWGVILFAHARTLPRLRALSRMANALIAGSLAELLAAVPAHVVVSRRPGCLVGLGTMLGILAGLNVMLFAFGPAIFLLFLRPRYRREQMEGAPVCDVCGYDLRASAERCPECGTPIPARSTPSRMIAP
jgi:hypothetical protein